MLHIIKNRKGKFEVVLVRNGKMVNTSSPQQYERKAGAITNIRSQLKYFGASLKYVQDDSCSPSVLIVVYADKRKPEPTQLVPKKRYMQSWEKTKCTDSSRALKSILVCPKTMTL
jgi:uncharacterized protein YegP (UPF0339 family)